MVSRCTYLNIILQTRAPEVLVKFIDVGGYKLLNNWLTYSKTTNNIPLLQQILLTLQHLPLTVDHLKQNNTAKLVKQLSKSSEDEELRKLASVLVSDWMAVIRSQSSTQPAEKDKKKRKEEGKSRTTLPERPLTEVKAETRAEEAPEKKKEKPKSLRTTAPSHAKFRSTGLELDTPSLVPVKKNSSTVVVSDKYNLKPIPLKRQSATAAPGDAAPPAEKKYKPLNTTPNTTKVLDLVHIHSLSFIQFKVEILPQLALLRPRHSFPLFALSSQLVGISRAFHRLCIQSSWLRRGCIHELRDFHRGDRGARTVCVHGLSGGCRLWGGRFGCAWLSACFPFKRAGLGSSR